ncbi:ribosomal protein L7/L12 [Nonomuraea sp. NBC_01738]|uniref:ribosomal protein L7/L12 n=1 Tax=Nonomuraea sp. NBC_01738 TaxID=2976003 RepID=UPI002E0EF15D|nr:ribosomal protein L7/L12 [Nonomuraea sp. NBC_01738]
MSLGIYEIIIIVVVLVVVLLAVGIGLIATARRGATPHRAITMTPTELEARLNAMVSEGNLIPAIKLLREQTGLGLKDAKDAVEGIRAGRRIINHPAMTRLSPGPHPVRHADLATRVRELRAAGRTEQAVLLVRGETGMNQADAERFVDNLT